MLRRRARIQRREVERVSPEDQSRRWESMMANLDALALTWAQVADDLVRTAAAEKKLGDLQKQVTDVEQKSVRTQALIEQTIARRGRAEQNLNALEAAKPAKVVAKPNAKEAPAPAAKAAKGGAKK